MTVRISKQFDLWLTLADPCMTFDRTMHNALVQELFGGNRALLSKLTPTCHQLTPT